jgi:purine nucleoside permease
LLAPPPAFIGTTSGVRNSPVTTTAISTAIILVYSTATKAISSLLLVRVFLLKRTYVLILGIT